MTEVQDITVAILREIRDELREVKDGVRQTNARLDQTNARLDQTNARLDQTNARLGGVEGAVVELAKQQRFLVRWFRSSSSRERRFERDLDALRGRVDVLEARVGTPSSG